jgi:hypothetical protein
MSTKKSRLIKSVAALRMSIGADSARKSIYMLRNDREGEYAIVAAHGAHDALNILRENDIDWHGMIGKGVSITCAQHGVDDEPQLIWFGFYGKRNAGQQERNAHDSIPAPDNPEPRT